MAKAMTWQQLDEWAEETGTGNVLCLPDPSNGLFCAVLYIRVPDALTRLTTDHQEESVAKRALCRAVERIQNAK